MSSKSEWDTFSQDFFRQFWSIYSCGWQVYRRNLFVCFVIIHFVFTRQSKVRTLSFETFPLSKDLQAPKHVIRRLKDRLCIAVFFRLCIQGRRELLEAQGQNREVSENLPASEVSRKFSRSHRLDWLKIHFWAFLAENVKNLHLWGPLDPEALAQIAPPVPHSAALSVFDHYGLFKSLRLGHYDIFSHCLYKAYLVFWKFLVMLSATFLFLYLDVIFVKGKIQKLVINFDCSSKFSFCSQSWEVHFNFELSWIKMKDVTWKSLF